MNVSYLRAKVVYGLLLAGLVAGPAVAAEGITAISLDDTTPAAGQTIQVTVDVDFSAAGDDWTSTFINLTDGMDGIPGTNFCSDQPEPDIIDGAAGAYQETIEYTLPSDLPAGNYFVRVRGFNSSNNCTGSDFDTQVTPIVSDREFDLALTIVDSPDPVVAGSGAGNLTHTFSLSRAGLSDSDGVAVDIVPTLPDGVTIVSAVPTTGSWAGTTWTVGDVAASANGAVGDLVITLTVDGTAAECTDCVSASGTASATSGTDTDPANNTDIVDPTSIVREFDLALTVVDSPDPVVAGSGAGNLTHTFSLSRAGFSDSDGVAVDIVPTLPAGVTIVSAVPTTGSSAGTTWTVGDVAASANGAVGDLVITLTVDGTAAECTDCVSASGSASATSGTDTDPANNTDIVDPTSIVREFDLALTVVDSPDPVVAGSGAGNLTHTFSLSRAGFSDSDGVAVDIVPTLPAGVTIVSAVPTTGSWAGTTWTVGDVAASANGAVGDLVITLTVDGTAAECTDCVSASGSASATSGTDTDPANNTDIVDPTSIEAAADASSGFDTGITFTNGYTGSVEVTLSCNTGVPLEQSFDISEGSGVNFVIKGLDFEAPDTTCDISLTGLDDGYTASVLANGEDTGSSCVYSGTPVADESAAFNVDGANTCAITAEPMASEFIVDVSWAGMDDPSISQEAAMMLSCSPAATDTGSDYTTVSVDVSGVGDNQYTLDFYPSTSGTTTCMVVVDQSSLDQAIEASVSCDDGDDVGFVIGDLEGGCEVTFTAFYEGIPTLSHYGMAIMALLMLGVGFVGFRRFV